MKKKIAFIIVLMVLLTGSVFAQNTFNKETLLQDVLQRVGSNYEEVIAKNGKPLAQTIEIRSDVDKSMYLIYSGMQIHIVDYNGQEELKFLYIYDPQFELVKGVSVGANINDVLKILGDDYTASSNPSVYRFDRYGNNYVIIITAFMDKVTKIEFWNTEGYM